MNQQEFEQIAAGLRQHAMAQALTVMRSAADAEDVAQDAMLRLWAVHSELRDANHARRLAKIAVRQLFIDSFRHRKRTSALIVTMNGKDEGCEWQPPDNANTGPDGLMEMEEDEKWLRQRMAALPDREMQVMRMRQTEQKSNDEIAAILGIGKASVATMLSAARKKIFEDLKKRNRQ